MTPEAPWLLWIGVEPPDAPPNWRIEAVACCADALASVTDAGPAVIVAACPLPEGTPEDLIEEIVRLRTGIPLLIDDPYASIADAVRYIRLGAHDVAGPGTDIMALAEAALDMNRGQRDATSGTAHEPWSQHLIGSSRAIERMIEIIRLAGERRSTVLITGETGTGKEMVARALHLASPRAHLPMVAVNCNALPENLLEAELFGHVKGAFTGAIHQRIGRFEQAHRSTLFLDEVGDLPLDMQAKLLRVLQEREFQRVGSSETIRVDIRLIAATNVNLLERVRQGRFREDLYYRLNVVPIATPPLRERREDIPLLVTHFVEKICRLEQIRPPRLTQETLVRLQSYSWPGNVRQLENMVETAVTLSGGRDVLLPSDFALPAQSPRGVPAASIPRAIALPDTGLDFDRTTGDIERQILEEALRKTHGNKAAAARILGLKRTTLAAKLKSLEAAACS